jgi:hypothetical protein
LDRKGERMSCIFRVKVNGEFLVFYPNTKVKYKIKTPYFNFNNEYKSQSYTFKIPVTGNEKTLDFAKGFNRRGVVYEFAAETFIGETYWKKAILIITNYTETDFSVKIIDDETAYFNFLNTELADFQYLRPSRFRHIASKNNSQYNIYEVNVVSSGSGDISGVVCDTSDIYVGDPDRVKFTVSFLVTDTEAEATTKMIDAINANFYRTGLWATTETATNQFRVYNMSSSPWLEFAFSQESLLMSNYVEATFSGVGSVGGGIPTITKALAKDTITQPSGTYDFIYVPVYNPDKDTATPSPTTLQQYDVINDWDADNQEFFSPSRNRFAPYPILYSLIEQIFNEAKIKFDDQFFDAELKSLLIYSNLLTAYNDGVSYNTWPYFQYRYIVPKIKVKDLLLNLRGYFGFIAEYNLKSKAIKLTSIKNELARNDFKDVTTKTRYGNELQYDKRIQNYEYTFEGEPLTEERMLERPELYGFAGELIDYGDLPLNARDNHVWHILNTNSYYYNDGDFGGTYWFYLCEVLQGIFDKQVSATNKPNGSVPFSIELYHRNDVGVKPVKWLIPYTKAATQPYVSQTTNNPFRLMFYRGLKDGLIDNGADVPDFDAMEYPFASYHNYDYNLNKVGNYSLAWLGPDGLFNQFHKEYDSILRNSRPVAFTMDYSIIDIVTLDTLQQNLRNGNLFIPDEYEITFGEVLEQVKTKEYLRK